MRTVQGDLLQMAEAGIFDCIIHGCNCQHTMGAGIAKQIRVRFPQAYAADLLTPKGAQKLGSISVANVQSGMHSFVIVNGYTQVNWRGSGIKVDYEAIRSVMRYVRRGYSGLRIGYPMIGAGLAGGDWSVVSQIIEEELNGEDHCLVEFKL